MKHKWHKEIKAWADGAEIEVLSNNDTWGVQKNPTWAKECEYRIKPSVKEPQDVSSTSYLYVYNHESYGLSISVEKRDVESSDEIILGKIKLEEE